MASWFKIETENSVVVPPPGNAQYVANEVLAILKKAGCPKEALVYSDSQDEETRAFFFSPQAAEILQKTWVDWASYYPIELSRKPDSDALHEVKCG